MSLRKIMVPGYLALVLLPASALGYSHSEATYQHVVIHRDTTYEQDLHYQASADKAITPVRVVHWLMGLTSGHTDPATPSRVEFQPIVHVHDSDVRIIAAINFKF